ncbi:hypothetical protein FXO38_18447 [Capsicum annuum]|uniref:PUB domain-containing protein n=1 Tax=Capsicum annuum TaxID=4072 RepID=A0A2G2YL61_CAPAN|nr:hypothetical protein FXO37_28613 [Capsicum annuum]KAF3647900.1 hypothetical protein FXO38_18447 [Capsicum annuum]PHT70469.1 hypothetical protein T459_25573 [Capsicum annuum]
MTLTSTLSDSRIFSRSVEVFTDGLFNDILLSFQLLSLSLTYHFWVATILWSEAIETAQVTSYQLCQADVGRKKKKLGLPPEDPASPKPSTAPVVEEKDDDANVKTAFNTLLTYAKIVATNPNEEKFRKIRLSNAAFQIRCYQEIVVP